MQYTSVLIILALVVHVHSAPQFITFKDGKLGVNFAGYHAGVGIGGGAGNGAAGGLYAEAGTPHGQAARAGLGGSVDGNGGSAGGLFAGATAGGNVKASAGLAGGVAAEKAAGSGYAAASAGAHEAASGLVGDREELVRRKEQRKEEKHRRKEQKKAQKAAAAVGGESSVSGSSGFKFSGTKSYGIPTTVIKETEVSAIPLEHKVHTEFKLDSANEIKHSEIDSDIDAPHVGVSVNEQPTVIEDAPKTIIEKTIVHTHHKPIHHHQTAYIGGYIGGEANAPPPAQERVDVGAESSAHAGFGGFQGSSHAGSDHVANGGGQITYKKEVAFEKNPNFFRDIFNIPISTLKAVSGLLSNTAASTSVKVEKSDAIHAGGYGQSNGYGQAGGQIGGSSQYGSSAHLSGGFGGYSHGNGFGQVENHAGGQISSPGQYGQSGQISGGFGAQGHEAGFGQIVGMGDFLNYATGGQIGAAGQYGKSAQINSGFGGYGSSSGQFEKSFQIGSGSGGHQFSANGQFKHGF